jgi:hypothetical protein
MTCSLAEKLFQAMSRTPIVHVPALELRLRVEKSLAQRLFRFFSQASRKPPQVAAGKCRRTSLADGALGTRPV